MRVPRTDIQSREVVFSMRKSKVVMDANLLRLLLLFIGLLMLFGFAKDWRILRSSMISNMLKQMPEYGIIALGIMITRISGRIDLSVVGIANISDSRYSRPSI